ncbi:hypothetical protein [Pseudomonas sp. ACN5]|uniref:hypothetical protein n=1 Tax=Pseudomonas sp. ACN5 TaxID=1920427 RepID=UPI0011439C30|nr:hypothetical protein [Pseudomonas sp. ACN5]PBJ02122.1 hypothetical protein BSF40_52210 [Pseudomonas sp. ACN5]
MSNQETLIHLAKILNKNQQELITQTITLLGTMAGEDSNTKKNAANQVSHTLDRIEHLIPPSQVPDWLITLSKKAAEYVHKKVSGEEFLNTIIEFLPVVKSYIWLSNDPSTSGFNFESVFDDCRSNSRIPELFDQLITALEKIRDSGELDSQSMIDALSKIIATMHIGKTSSYFSMDGAWQFLCTFAENFLWNELSKIPVLGSMTDALRETMKETQMEILKLYNDVKIEMTEQVQSQVRPLRNSKDVFNLYGRSGNFLKVEDKSQTLAEA